MDKNAKTTVITSQSDLFLEFFKANYKLFHNSNVFRKDVYYAVKRYLEIKNINCGFTELEYITDAVVSDFKNKGIFIELTPITWRLINETYLTSAQRVVIDSTSK